MNDDKAVRQAVERWFVALNAMLNGDPAPFADLWHQSAEVLYFGAEGSACVGWREVYADWTRQADKARGGSAKCSDLHVLLADDTAVAHFRTVGTVKTPDGRTVDTVVRESSVYRKGAGQWKLIAHHADNLLPWEDVVKA